MTCIIFPVLATMTTNLIMHVLAVPTHFNLSAISSVENVSVIQCWQLTEPLSVSSTNGIAGATIQQLGDVANASWGFLPANFMGTAHPAPMVQFVVFLSGKTQITIPNSAQSAIFEGGATGIIIAEDTAERSVLGHISSTLGESVSALQIPIKDGNLPSSRVLYDGACKTSELYFGGV